jgi:hypothetical protein
MKFSDAPFPRRLADVLRQEGGRPVAFKSCVLPGLLLTVLVADEPTKSREQLERHASISLCTEFGQRKMPTRSQIKAALKAVGITTYKDSHEGDGTFHVWLDVPEGA